MALLDATFFPGTAVPVLPPRRKATAWLMDLATLSTNGSFLTCGLGAAPAGLASANGKVATRIRQYFMKEPSVANNPKKAGLPHCCGRQRI